MGLFKEYRLAEKLNKEREKNKKLIRLKWLVKKQGKRIDKIKNLDTFFILIDNAKTEEKIKEICLKYDFLPNLELF